MGRNRDSAGHAGIGDDEGFLLVAARVQHFVRDALRREQVRQEFGLLDRGGAEEDRLAFGIGLAHFLDDLGVLRLGRAIDDVVIILA